LPSDIEFPPQLKKFFLSFQGSYPSDSSFNKLLLGALLPLSRLEELTIFAPNQLEKSTYIALLTSLTMLKEIRFETTADPANIDPNVEREVVEVSHPNLRSLPLISGLDFVSACGNLPNLDNLALDSTSNHFSLGPEHAARMPSIRTLDVDHSHWNSAFASRLKLLDRVELMGAAQDDLPTSLLELSSLQHVELYGYHLTEAFCEELISRITRLQSLRISQKDDNRPHSGDSLLRSLDWLNRPNMLLNLAIMSLGAFLKPGRLRPIRMHGHRLPFLTTVSLSFANSRGWPASIAVDSLPNLKSFSLSSSERIPAVAHAAPDLSVLSCPNLLELMFNRMAFKSIRIINLPRLDCLQLLDSLIVATSQVQPVADKFQVSDIPNLYTFNFSPSTPLSPASELSEAFAAIVRVNAPKLV
jgi:Leucine-rich repeat (LRR) protein